MAQETIDKIPPQSNEAEVAVLGSMMLDRDAITTAIEMLQAAHGKIDHRRLDRVSPLAVPVMLSIGKESVGPAMIDELLDDAGESLIAEAMRGTGSGAA